VPCVASLTRAATTAVLQEGFLHIALPLFVFALDRAATASEALESLLRLLASQPNAFKSALVGARAAAPRACVQCT
jgi:hypothetical protein